MYEINCATKMKCLIKLLGQNTIFYEVIGVASIGFYFIACLSSNLSYSCVRKPTFTNSQFWDIAWLITYSLFFQLFMICTLCMIKTILILMSLWLILTSRITFVCFSCQRMEERASSPLSQADACETTVSHFHSSSKVLYPLCLKVMFRTIILIFSSFVYLDKENWLNCVSAESII